MKARPSILFVVPDTQAFQSGGNIYNACLIDALQQIGADVRQQTISEFTTEGIAATTQYIIWDSLYLYADQLKVAVAVLPTFLLVHHLESLYPPEGWTSEAYFLQQEYQQLSLFAGFIANSTFTKDYLAQYFDEKTYVEIPPALGLTPIRVPKASDTIQALIVGNLIERKGLLPFLELLQQHAFTNLTIRIIGSADHEPSYAAACLARIDKLPAVQYIGELNYQQMSQQYEWANVLVSCSKMETFGMALQEAVAFGVPILALDKGNARAHIGDGITGWLSPTISDLIDRLEQLEKEPEQHATFLQNAGKIDKWGEYTWEMAGEELVQGVFN